MPSIKVNAALIEDEYDIKHRWIFFGPEAVLSVQRANFDHNKSRLQVNEYEWIVDMEASKLARQIERAVSTEVITQSQGDQ